MSFGKSKKVSYTSILSYRELIKNGQGVTESKRVLAYLLDKEPHTSRKLSTIFKIERTNITRTLSDLLRDEIVEVSFIEKCPITKRPVQHYGLIEKFKSPEQKKEGN